MRRTRLEIVLPEIIDFFHSYPQKAFTMAAISQVLISQREHWRLPKSTTIADVVGRLTQAKRLSAYKFTFSFQPLTLYLWDTPNPYEVALALRTSGYLSHLSALVCHGLVQHHINDIIYINQEQSAKPPPPGSLSQTSIDSAFKRPHRLSQNRAEWNNITFCVISGKYTDSLGVVTIQHPNIPGDVRVTGIERTLIDIVVRPVYAGGVQNVLEAYKRAAARVSGKKLRTTLRKLGYKYPYHQAVGFYLEQSGCYDAAVIDLFRKPALKYDFYLDYAMKDVLYSPEWRVYYPRSLDSE